MIRTDGLQRLWWVIIAVIPLIVGIFLFSLLLDLNDPTKVLARSEDPIMVPTEDYEKYGFYGNVVFTNGHLVDGDKITMYYGASDEVICGAEFSINEILASLGVLEAATTA